MMWEYATLHMPSSCTAAEFESIVDNMKHLSEWGWELLHAVPPTDGQVFALVVFKRPIKET